MNARSVLAVAACGLVAGALALGARDLGSPDLNRARAADQRVIEAIASVARTIHWEHETPHRLPALPGVEPAVRRDLAFARESDERYAICATFRIQQTMRADDGPMYDQNSSAWSHPAGRACYAFSRSGMVPLGPARARR